MKAKPLLLTVLLTVALCTPLTLINIPIGLCSDSQTILVPATTFNATDWVSYPLDFIAEPAYQIRIDNLVANTSTPQILNLKFPKNVSGDSPALKIGQTHAGDKRLIIDWATAAGETNLVTPTDYLVNPDAFDIEITWYPHKLDIKYWNGTHYNYALQDYDLDAWDIGKIMANGEAIGGAKSGHMNIAVTELAYGSLHGMFDELLPMLMYLMVIGAICGIMGGITKKMGKW